MRLTHVFRRAPDAHSVGFTRDLRRHPGNERNGARVAELRGRHQSRDAQIAVRDIGRDIRGRDDSNMFPVHRRALLCDCAATHARHERQEHHAEQNADERFNEHFLHWKITNRSRL